MALASTRPMVVIAESALRRIAAAGQGTQPGGSPFSPWDLLGSFITEPGAMTIYAVLLEEASCLCSPTVQSPFWQRHPLSPIHLDPQCDGSRARLFISTAHGVVLSP